MRGISGAEGASAAAAATHAGQHLLLGRHALAGRPHATSGLQPPRSEVNHSANHSALLLRRSVAI